MNRRYEIMKLVNKDEMKAIDKNCSDIYGIPSIILMENAGAGAYQFIKENIDDHQNKTFVIFCGGGNNGGDGLVIARKLFLNGIDTLVIFISDVSKSSKDNSLNFNIIRSIGVPIEIINSEDDWSKVEESLKRSDILIDSIFGIGFHGKISGYIYRVIEFINAFHFHKGGVIAVDIPSGIASDGSVSNIAVEADYTLTFGLPKVSMVDFPARNHIGHRSIVNIDIPMDLLYDDKLKNNLLTFDDVQDIFIYRDRDVHKGDFGHLLIIGGKRGMSGAAMIASVSALRSGAGMVTAAIPESIRSSFECAFPEIMTLPIDENDVSIARDSIERFIKERRIVNVLIGNGWGVGDRQSAIVSSILKNTSIERVLFDADGLNNISADRKLLNLLNDSDKEIVITPHIKEMARLIDSDTKTVKDSKRQTAVDFSNKYKVTTLLKDSISVIAFPDGQTWYNEFGGPSLAKGGSGDMLAGIIAGLFTSGYNVQQAALLGSYILGRTGEIYEEEFSNVSSLAMDLVDLIPVAFRELET